MIFSLDILPAAHGDCLLLHYGEPEDTGLMVIDGGPPEVYETHLRPRLEALRAARVRAGDPLVIDVLMVSHIDDDHIGGILAMTRELSRDGAERPFRALSVWHNALGDLLGDDARPLSHSVTAAYGAASLTGEPDVEGLDHTAAMVLASVSQGLQLRIDADKLNWPINAEFDGALIEAGQPPEPFDLGFGLTMTVIGPMAPEIKKLQDEYRDFLKKKENERGRAPVLAAFTDTSIPNLSSIVALVEVDGRTMLLTGDARGDKIMKGLRQAELLIQDGPFKVDVLKVPHHGSSRDVETSFFAAVHADHYVFSGNGLHGNPERETLAMLLEARPDAAFTLYFTYPLAVIDAGRKKDWNKQQASERKRRNKAKVEGKDEVSVRPDWSEAEHGLASFLAARGLPNARQAIVEIAEGARHTIDLHDALTV